MKIKLETKYKSIHPFDEIDIPQFTILTGINGRGKTQLLEAIIERAVKPTDLKLHIEQNDVVLLYNNQLNPTTANPIYVNPFKDRKVQVKSQFTNVLRSSGVTTDIIFKQRYGESWQLRVLQDIAGKIKKKLTDLTEDDIEKYYPHDDGQDNGGLFYQNFSEVFTRYGESFERNEYNQFKSSKGHKGVSFLKDNEFINLHGEPPWDFVNEVLHNANIGFKVSPPNIFNFDQQNPQQYQLRLIKIKTGEEIHFTELSSGEKVMMTLALAILNSKKLMKLPQLLMLDEPDAALHPSLIKQFLDVVINLFCIEKKMHVIISTHSPSTIALAPESSIYAVNNESKEFITKISKDHALKSLLHGVPSVSVQYENRRQIFVESKNDVLYFEFFYRKLNKYLTQEISISFISSGDAKKYASGNCDQVYKICELLRNGGNKSVFGIVDFDTKNKDSENVFVLGNNSRYSIENFIFDPLIISLFLLHGQLFENSKIGLNDDESFADIKNFGQEKLQGIVNFFLSDLKNVNKLSDGIVTCSYINGITINVPEWYLLTNGHELEKQILENFKPLNKIIGNSGSDSIFKLEVLKVVVNQLPEFIPKDILDLFIRIQAN